MFGETHSTPPHTHTHIRARAREHLLRLTPGPICSQTESVGLVNLGATCYVNSLLQMWFHNLPFRDAVLRWRPIAGASSSNTDVVAMEKLQEVFAYMQCSLKRVYNPVAFVDSMGIEHMVQQDAQEFFKLFTALVERQLQLQPDKALKKMITTEYGGQYVHRTTCTNCNKSSDHVSTFFELSLPIQGHTSIDECLQSYFQKEFLDGDNKYSCSYCNAKHDATRQVVLRKVPDLLNIGLLRFVFDLKTLSKKKLASGLHFSETMDLSEYLPGLPKKDCLYDLQALLLHRGPSAYHGHYVAQIRNLTTDSWVVFDDDEATPLEPSKLTGRVSLGQDKENGKATAAGKDVPPHTHRSKSVYLLSYRRRSTKPKIAKMGECELPQGLQEAVLDSNQAFRVETESFASASKAKEALISNQDALVREQMGRLSQQEGPREWISRSWMMEWLKQPVLEDDTVVETRPLDNSGLLCQHKRLSPQKKGDAKLVSSKGVDWIEKHHGVTGGRLPESTALCKDCVAEKFLLDRGSQRLAVSWKGTERGGMSLHLPLAAVTYPKVFPIYPARMTKSPYNGPSAAISRRITAKSWLPMDCLFGACLRGSDAYWKSGPFLNRAASA